MRRIPALFIGTIASVALPAVVATQPAVAATAPGTITGVTDVSPFPGAYSYEVEAFPAAGGPAVMTLTADGGGVYSLQVAPGSYYVWFLQVGRSFATAAVQLYRGASSYDAATVVTVV